MFDKLLAEVKKEDYYFSMNSLSSKEFYLDYGGDKKNPACQFVISGKAEGFTQFDAEELKLKT